jgi:alkaline phosphatase D
VLRSLEAGFLGINPHIDYMDLVSQGYGLVELTPEEATVTFRVIDTFDRTARASTRATWRIPATTGLPPPAERIV